MGGEEEERKKPVSLGAPTPSLAHVHPSLCMAQYRSRRGEESVPRSTAPRPLAASAPPTPETAPLTGAATPVAGPSCRRGAKGMWAARKGKTNTVKVVLAWRVLVLP